MSSQICLTAMTKNAIDTLKEVAKSYSTLELNKVATKFISKYSRENRLRHCEEIVNFMEQSKNIDAVTYTALMTAYVKFVSLSLQI